MPNLAKNQKETAVYSDNILNKFSLFEDSVTWITDGYTAVENSNLLPYAYGKGGIKITFINDVYSLISYPNSDINVTIKKTGLHLFAFRVFKPDPTADITLFLRISINGIITSNTIFDANFYNTSGFVDGTWNTYFQTLNLNEDDVVSYAFETLIGAGSIGAILYLGGFKLELLDRNIIFPSFYTKPLDTILETTETIDIPSISSNSSYTAVVTLTGATDGDFVQMSIPSIVGNTGLVFSQPYVSDINEISFVVHNHTGGSIDASSGDFKFKIIK